MISNVIKTALALYRYFKDNSYLSRQRVVPVKVLSSDVRSMKSDST